VTWVGDREALPHQLNGKSSNINHMVLSHMYPHVTATKDVPYRDILMVMDCDHLVEPEFFAKCCAVMLDRDVAVCLVPQVCALLVSTAAAVLLAQATKCNCLCLCIAMLRMSDSIRRGADSIADSRVKRHAIAGTQTSCSCL
jgi:hypothetical protein